MAKFLKSLSWLKLAVYIMPLCYLFVSLFTSLFSDGGDIQARALFITVWLIASFLLTDKKNVRQPVLSAVIFCLYTFAVYLVLNASEDTSFLSTFSCIFVWPIALYNSMHLKLKPNDIEFSTILLGICCNVMAFIWYNGTRSYFGPNAVAAVNSAYYILVALLYVFLIRNSILKLILIPYPIFVLLSSDKTTCILLTLALTSYFFYHKVKTSRLLYKIGILTIFLIALYYASQIFDYDDINNSVLGDFDSGGSGRLNIWSAAINVLLSSSDLSLLFGHGYSATSTSLNIGAHNDFLEIVINFGVVGLLLYSFFIYHLLSRIKLITKNNDYRMIYIMSIIVFFAMTMVSKLVCTQIQFLLFTTIWGLLINQNKSLK